MVPALGLAGGGRRVPRSWTLPWYQQRWVPVAVHAHGWTAGPAFFVRRWWFFVTADPWLDATPPGAVQWRGWPQQIQILHARPATRSDRLAVKPYPDNVAATTSGNWEWQKGNRPAIPFHFSTMMTISMTSAANCSVIAKCLNCSPSQSLFRGSLVRPVAARPQSRVRRVAARAAHEPTDASLEVMRKFSEQYASRSNTFFCVDKSVTAVVIKGLAEHKDTLGAPLCPCRHYDDKQAEAENGYWNCPCVPMRERKECHCMLFLTPENDFAGQEQKISMEEVKELTKGM
eukprot:jgi/Mesvir1/12430/Mv00595-RA.1